MHELCFLGLFFMSLVPFSCTFQDAFVFTLKNEGGYVDNISDKGGATNYGISKTYLSGYILKNPRKIDKFDKNNNKIIDSYDIKNLSFYDAKGLYLDWWEFYGYYRISSKKLSIKVFDMAINMGHKQAVKLLQRSIGIKEDGKLDDFTINIINKACKQKGEHAIILTYCKTLELFYVNLCELRPKYRVFLKGWLRRAALMP